MLLDEPFAALGPAHRREMFNLLVSLLPDATLLMVTHDPEEAPKRGQYHFRRRRKGRGMVETPRFFANPSAAVRRHRGLGSDVDEVVEDNDPTA